MTPTGNQKELIRHLCGHFGISDSVASQLIAEVLAYNNQSYESFIHQRHRELQKTGVPNKVAYGVIQEELSERRFLAPALSERQIRRIIYG